jgi:hypothetical protein
MLLFYLIQISESILLSFSLFLVLFGAGGVHLRTWLARERFRNFVAPFFLICRAFFWKRNVGVW